GHAVLSWGEARWQLTDAVTGGGRVNLQVETAEGATRERVLQLPAGVIEPDGADPMAEVGLALATPRPKINAVNEGSPGQQAGLREGDIIVRIGELRDPDAGAVVQAVQKRAGQVLPLTILRGDTPLTLNITPESQELP